ncbi:hypothetical protein [Cytobacillus sp.]|uniref:hypothetical protein n=1 Tax=Cytobacillus sp. TaxID=2675269 RepID=UPI0028BDF35C|nr:hypothetical protein [Cytobacillus sp.]
MALLFGFNEIALTALLLSFLSGMLEQRKGITLNLYMQKASSMELLPKLYSVKNVIVSLGFGLSTLLFGWIAERAGRVLIISYVYLYINRKIFFSLGQLYVLSTFLKRCH